MGVDSIDLIDGLDCDYVLLATIDSYVADIKREDSYDAGYLTTRYWRFNARMKRDTFYCKST